MNERSERERLAVPANAKPNQNAGEHEQTLRLRLRNACIAAACESCPETAVVLEALWSCSEPLPGEDVNVLVDVLLELNPSKALQLLMGKKGMLVPKNAATGPVPQEGLVGSGTMPAVFGKMGNFAVMMRRCQQSF